MADDENSLYISTSTSLRNQKGHFKVSHHPTANDTNTTLAPLSLAAGKRTMLQEVEQHYVENVEEQVLIEARLVQRVQ